MIINVNSNLFMHTAFFKVLLRFLHEIGYTKVGKFLSSKLKKAPCSKKGDCAYTADATSTFSQLFRQTAIL